MGPYQIRAIAPGEDPTRHGVCSPVRVRWLRRSDGGQTLRWRRL